MNYLIEGENANRFLGEELPKSIGIKYPPEKIKSVFNIKTKDGIWRFREEK